MAKKKKKNEDHMDDMLGGLDIFTKQLTTFMENNNLSPLDVLEGLKQMQSGSYVEMLNKNYDYKKPDYKASLQPLHPALEPLMEIYDISKINSTLEAATEELKKETPETARKELINALYHILAYQEDFINDPEDKRNGLALYTVLQTMISLDVKDVTDAMIELLRQDAYFYEFFFSGFEEDMSIAISKLAGDSLDKLEKFMYETGRIAPVKCIVAEGVVQMALDNPMVKLSIVAWFARVLKRYSEILVYPTNIDGIAWAVAHLKAKELEPYVMKLYEINEVPFIKIKGEKELKKIMNDGIEGPLLPYTSLLEVFSEIEKNSEDEEDDDHFSPWTDEDFNPWPDEDEDDYDEDEDEILKNSAANGEFFTLEVSLNDSPIEVKRTFKVPSHIRLGALSQVLMRVMGWEGYHMNQYIKGHTYYCDAESIEEGLGWDNEEIDYNKVALNEVLKRKGSNIIWEYDFGDSWEHTVKVVGREKWTEKSKIEVLEAVNACPPEDCGGVWGYGHLLKVLADKKDPEYKEMKEWVGRGFNPNKVSVEKLNKAIAHFNEDIREIDL